MDAVWVAALAAILFLVLVILLAERRPRALPPSRKSGPPAAGDHIAKDAARLLVLVSCSCMTTTSSLGASKDDQYRLAATCYLDVCALVGREAGDRLVARYPGLFSRARASEDKLMRRLAIELRDLARQLDATMLAGDSDGRIAAYLEARLAGFMR